MMYEVINITENRVISVEYCYGNAAELAMVMDEIYPECEFKIVEVEAA